MRFRDFIGTMRESESDNGRMGATLDTAIGGTAEVVATREGAQAGYELSRRALQEGEGFRPAGRAKWQGYDNDFREAKRMVEASLTGNRYAALRLQEALTTSDFPLLFGDVLDRSTLANYAETPYTWDLYCARKILNDMRLARQFRVDRGAAVLDGPILPNTFGASGSGPTGLEQVSEYPLRKRVVTGYTDQLYKFGCRMDFSLETMLNDDLDALKDTPALFGRAARRTEEKRATKLYVTSSGPNTAFFNNANKNLINATVLPNYTGSPNPALSIDAIMNALIVLSNQRDLDGEPISIEAAVLVYPPALHVTAQNILNARELWLNIEGGLINTYGATANPTSNFTAATSAARLNVANWAANFARPALNYYLPVVDTTFGNTAWYIFASPKTGRPALQQSFLRGREAPQLFMRLPNQVAIGEGMMGPGAGAAPGTMNVNPMEGDFETDAIDYKIRHFIGGTLLDPILAVASTGANA